MNIERLYSILIEVQEDLKSTQLLTKLTAVKDNLQNQVNQPSEPSYQINLVDSIKTIYDALDEYEINLYTPSVKAHLSEIAKGSVLGKELKKVIQETIASNQMWLLNRWLLIERLLNVEKALTAEQMSYRMVLK